MSALAALMLLGACQSAATAAPEGPPTYLGVETEVLDKSLLAVRVALKGAQGPAGIDAYARCAVAGDTIARGFSYARHIRTIVDKNGGIWRGDAVYTLSAARPQGLKTIDAAAAVRDCEAMGIPTA